MVTNAGWLFHYSDGTRPARDTDPAFAGPITTRPNEAAEQFVPDTAPVDDSQLFAPPPVAIETAPAEAPEPEQLAALITGVRKPKARRAHPELELQGDAPGARATGRAPARQDGGQDREPDVESRGGTRCG